MRLIDADAIPELFDKEYKATRLLIEQGEEHLDNLAEGFTEAHNVIQRMATIDAAPVRHGRWEWFEEWSQSTTEHQAECQDCGWRCGECKTALEDIVGGYWDDIDREPMMNYCPNCGARME